MVTLSLTSIRMLQNQYRLYFFTFLLFLKLLVLYPQVSYATDVVEQICSHNMFKEHLSKLNQ